MKRVGIITMHRVQNYGSVLQAYATQWIIEKMGYECEIIDYQYPNEWQYQRGVKRPIYTWKNYLAEKFQLRPFWRWKHKLDYFIGHYLHLSEFYDSPDALLKCPPKYDIYVTGSDQVWNPLHTKGDLSFLLDFVKAKEKIAYASSFATDVLNEDCKKQFKLLLQEYKSISVREKGGQRIIRELTGKEVPVVLDPTLLLDSVRWSELAEAKHNKYKGKSYILVYMLSYALDPSPVIYDLIEKLQNETHLPIISIGKLDNHRVGHYKKIDDAGVFTFLQLFLNASYVVTSSFHGTAFAVNFGKPLYSIVPDSGDDRQSTLLKNLGIPQCIVPVTANVHEIGKPVYNPRQVEEKLNSLRGVSIKYLQNSLASCR